MTKAPLELFESVECLEDCAQKILVAQVPAEEKLKVLVNFKGKTKAVLRVEYQDIAGWFTYDAERVSLIEN